MNKSVRYAVGVALCASSMVAHPDIIYLRFNAVPTTQTGKVGTKWPAGDEGNDSVLKCDLTGFPELAVQTGTPFSSNIRSKLSGTGAATATISILTISGTNAATGGWSISGNNLVNPATTTNNGVLQVQATYLGVTVLCGAQSWNITAPAPLETQLPTAPYGIVASSISGGVRVTWDPACDPYNSQAGSGVASYVIRKDAAGPQTVTAGASCIMGPWTLTNPSSLTVSNSFNGTGNVVSGTGAVSGVPARIAPMWSQPPFGGDKCISGRVSSHTAGADGSLMGPVISGGLGLDGTHDWLLIGQRKNLDGTIALQVHRRVGGTVSVVTTSPNLPSNSYWKACRIGNLITTDYSLDGGEWGELAADQPLSLPTTAYYGFFVAAGGTGTSTTSGELRNIAVFTPSRPSYDYTTATAGTFRVGAVDVNGNAGFQSPTTPSVGPSVASPSGLDYKITMDNCTNGDTTEGTGGSAAPAWLTAVGFEFSRHEGRTTCSNEHARVAGGKSLRIQSGAGIGACAGSSYCPPTEIGHPHRGHSVREELQLTGNVTVSGVPSVCMNGQAGCGLEGKTVRVGLSYFIRTITYYPSGGPLFLQLHQLGPEATPPWCDTAQPYFTLTPQQEGLRVTQRRYINQTPGVYPGGVCQNVDSEPYNRDKVFGSFTGTTTTIGTLPLNRWFDMLFEWTFDKDGGQALTKVSMRIPSESSSYTELYNNSTLPVGFEIFGTFNQWHSHFKFGIYNPATWIPNFNGVYDLHIDELYVTKPNEGSAASVQVPVAAGSGF